MTLYPSESSLSNANRNPFLPQKKKRRMAFGVLLLSWWTACVGVEGLGLHGLLQKEARQLQLLVEPPPASAPASGELCALLVEATRAAAFVVDPVAARVPPLAPDVPVVHVFAPVVYFDERSSPEGARPKAPPHEFASFLERREGTRRLLRVVAPQDREAAVLDAFPRRVLTARRRGHLDCLVAVDDGRGAAARPFEGDEAVQMFWVGDAAVPEVFADDARASRGSEIFVRPTRTDARARLERCASADDDALYWLCDHPEGIQGSKRMLPAGARYVADINPAGSLPTADDAAALRDSGAVALVLRWHAVAKVLEGDRRRVDALATYCEEHLRGVELLRR